MSRPKKSDSAKKNEGNFREDRAQDKQDKIEGDLTSQDFVFRTPNSTYKLLVTIAKETGTHSKQFCISLRMLAVNLHHWAKLVRVVDKSGFTYTTKSTTGDIVKKSDPDAEQMDKAFKRVMVGLKAHGFDPGSAASVSADESDGKNKLFEALADLMGGGDLEDEFDE
jgi:hypothetical protein